MPNFDGTGPLKRGRVIGRGLGPCKQFTEGCTRKAVDREPQVQDKTAKE
jgi:hypothetical protein